MKSKEKRSNNKCVYICLIVLSFFLTSNRPKQDVRYVNSLSEFKKHTSTHIQNVYRLGMYLYFEHRDSLFKDVPEEVIREKLLFHDFEKLASPNALKQFGYTDKRTFIERLYNYYGESREHKKLDIKILVDELNRFAGHYDNLVFKKHDLIDEEGRLHPIAKKVLLIERIADLVEREKNPVSPEEFGVRKMLKASEFFKGQREKQLSDDLAKIYLKIVQPNPLIYIVKLDRSLRTSAIPYCSSLFN